MSKKYNFFNYFEQFLLKINEKTVKKSAPNSSLLFKEQFKYLKTTHAFHLVDPSP